MIALILALLPMGSGEALPKPTEARKAVERSLPFLMKSSLAWKDNRKCVTCHQVPFALWPAYEAKTHGIAVDAKELDGLTAWSLEFCMTNKNKDEFTGGFLSTMTRMVLALEKSPKNETIGKAYEFFVPLIAKRQRPDGSWKEGNFIGLKDAEREGIEVDTMWTILSLNQMEKQAGKNLSPAAVETIQSIRRKASDWLKDAKPGTRTDWVALRMLFERQAGNAKQAAHWQEELLKMQNKDGGFAFVRGGESHPIVTGECLYALAEVGKRGDDAAVGRAWQYLISTQQKDGSWRTTSRAAIGKGELNKVNEINIHWGTGWATVGLLRTMSPATSSTSDRR